jgi:FkbM family methyltransferase
MLRALAVKLVRLFRPDPGEDAARGVRWLAARRFARRKLNWVYNNLSPSQQEAFHSRFSSIFRDYKGYFESGEWQSKFCGRLVKVPLEKELIWLHWDAAVSVLGHESDIKQTYESLLRLETPPRLVLDVGANYGTHSILFLIHGVPTISFEPNRNCHQFFRELCEINHVDYKLEPVAVGAEQGTVELWFPETREWLGTTDLSVKNRLQSEGDVSKLEVLQITLDSYVERHGLRPQLIKIDTEGTSLQVLLGCARTLKAQRPLVLFESWPSEDRNHIESFFSGNQYQICNLPLPRVSPPQLLANGEFLRSNVVNFIAVPRENIEAWPPRFN